MTERTSNLPADPETEWDMLVALLDPAKQRESMEGLLDRYGPTVRMRLAAARFLDVEDAYQSFVTWVLMGNRFANANESRGNFRCFLAKMISNWVANVRRDANAQKRGAGAEHLTLDEKVAQVNAASEEWFDRAWARNLLRLATKGMESKSGSGEMEDILLEAMLGRSIKAREQLLSALKREVRATSRYGLVEEELQYLLKVLLTAGVQDESERGR